MAMEQRDWTSTRLIPEWQAAALARIGEWHFAYLRQRGRVPPHVVVRGKVMYALGDVIRWCDGRVCEWRLAKITGRPWIVR